MLFNCLAVGVGGFFGSILRYLLSILTPNAPVPWATFGINVVGSFLLALLAGLALRGIMPDDHVSLMLRVGFCGGFTALSAFSLETAGMVSNGVWLGAAAYAVGTVLLCVLATFAGTWLARI